MLVTAMTSLPWGGGERDAQVPDAARGAQARAALGYDVWGDRAVERELPAVGAAGVRPPLVLLAKTLLVLGAAAPARGAIAYEHHRAIWIAGDDGSAPKRSPTT